MTARTFSFSVLPEVQAGNTVIDQMVAKMTEWQLSNGGQAVYSFQLTDPAWRFLGENHPERLPYKPANTVQINDFISPRGESALVSPGGAGFRAFEGGPAEGNVTSIQGRGAGNRCFWDEAGDAMWHSSGSTGSTDTKQNLMKYNAATDEFLHWTSGGPSKALPDPEASLWPGYGMAHNFGTTAWDAGRRRMYRMLRPNLQGTFFWVGEINVGDAQSYTSRETWIADRERWVMRRPESFDFRSLWPQTVYAPEFDSLIVLTHSSDKLYRYNCATRQFSQYNISFRVDPPRSSHASEGAPYLNVGPVLFYRDRSLYLASHTPGHDRTQPAQFWRFDFSADGNTVSGPVQLATCPVPMTLAGYSYPGDHTNFCMLGDQLYAFHGDMRDSAGIVPPEYTGGVYRYNFGTDTWSDILPGSESWCRKLLDMGVNVDSEPHNWTVTEIPRLGAFLIAQAFDTYVFGSFLFKPPL